MNADWAKGRNERTGEEGIFPRSYVTILSEKTGGGPPALPGRNQTPASSYGNMPLDVAQGQQNVNGDGNTGGGSKFNEQGKKFGKKLGNAAIFGAGASIGSNIVNGIF
jgi:LAS seventeen-binding protein 1/2